MEQFKIDKNPRLNKFYKKILDFFTKKYKNTESLVIDPTSVKLPTPYCLVIRYSVTNKAEKYELVLQGDWRTWYAEMANDSDLEKPKELDVVMTIRHKHDKSLKLN